MLYRAAAAEWYHPAVVRIALFLACLVMRGQTLEDAARSLARATSGHLAASERGQVSLHNLSSLSAAEAGKVLAAFDRGMRRNVRNPTTVEVTLTISENIKGYLLISEIGDGPVEMASVRRLPAAAPAPAGITITKKLLWEQSAPILDVAVVADFMFVLDTLGVSRYERKGASWDRVGVLQAASSVRDPRGRLEIEGDSVTIRLPGSTCRGPWNPSVSLNCEPASSFTAGRNTLEAEGLPAHFSYARANGVQLTAEMDGRTHIYDSSGKALAAFDGWGSDFAAMQGACRENKVLASAGGSADVADSVTLYDVANNAPSRLTDAAGFAGPVTALWARKDGALAVIRDLSTSRYEAYSIAVDCGR